MPKYRVCLFFSDTGGGHRQATQAINAALQEIMSLHPKNEELILTAENIVEKSHFINRVFVDTYNFLLSNHQKYMKYYYRFLHVVAPNDSWFGYVLVANYLKKLILQNRPSVIVSIHPMVNHYLAKAIEELGLARKVKLIEVVTDPNTELWKGWACSRSDLIIAPNDLARNKLVAYGVPPEKIKIIGMPVHPDFLKPMNSSRDTFLRSIGLKSHLPVICINAGWAGGGNMLKVYRALITSKKKIQIIFLCGRNKAIYQEATSMSKGSGIPTKVMRFYKLMPQLMSFCDLMVTKAGGLTTFEAIAKRLPLAIDLQTLAMPQEKGTAEILIQQKLAVPIYKPEDILEIAELLEHKQDRESALLPTAHNLDQTNAVYEIAKTIIASCNPFYDPITELETVSDTKYGAEYATFGFEGPGFYN